MIQRTLSLLVVAGAILLSGCSKGDDASATATPQAVTPPAKAGGQAVSAGTSPTPGVVNPDAVPQMGAKAK